MRLIECHIENFGRLQGFDYKFVERCNFIAENNGWGKSTLAAFIRIMLFGFEGEKKRSGSENERKRWTPWQGGLYGGYLVFENKGCSYRVTRTFGQKAADDTFELRDASTGLISNDFSDQIGVELFGVNSESFMRTVFIGQNEVATATTDGINARIGNVADDTMDLDSYEKTAEMLTGLLNQNSPSRATGSIRRLKDEVLNLQSEINSMSGLDSKIEETEKKITEGDKALVALAEYMDSNVSGQRKVAECKDIQSVIDVYNKISDDCNERIAEVNAKRALLPETLPTESELKEYMEIASEAAELNGQVKGCHISKEDEEYLARLREKYAAGDVDEDKLIAIQRRWNEREKMLLEEANEAAAIKVDLAEAASRAENVRIPTKAYCGLIFILLAVVMAIVTVLFSPEKMFTYAGFAMSGAVAVCGILFGVFVSRNHRADMDEYFDEVYADIDKKETELRKQAEKRHAIEAEVEKLFKALGVNFSVKNVQEDIHAIRSEMDNYERLLIKQKDYYEALGEYEKVNSRLIAYIKGLGIEKCDDAQNTLNELCVALNSYEEAKRNADIALRAKETFEKEKDIDTLKMAIIPENMPDISTLTEEYEQMGREALRIGNELKDDKHRFEALMEEKAIRDDKMARLDELRGKLSEAENRYHTLELTARYLASAKETFTSKYMGPLMTSFEKYYCLVTGTHATDYRMDANINISVEQMGGIHDADLMSAGYRDLIGLCMRFAMVDAMYKDEKPTLILDDPFVNFDSKKREGAAKLLAALSKEYQVIYFTCN